jgi:mannose-6-phosphate isomerase
MPRSAASGNVAPSTCRGRYASPMAGDHDDDGGRMGIDRARIVGKPWGHEEIFALVEGKFCGKVLHVNAGEALSLQYHERKEEVIAVQSGRCWMQAGEHESEMTVLEMGPGDSIHLPAGARHRVEAITDVVLLEVSTTELDDVVRLEDRYGREGTSEP